MHDSLIKAIAVSAKSGEGDELDQICNMAAMQVNTIGAFKSWVPDLYKCENSGRIFGVERLKHLSDCEDLNQRLEPGDPVPDGECECGAFAYRHEIEG